MISAWRRATAECRRSVVEGIVAARLCGEAQHRIGNCKGTLRLTGWGVEYLSEEHGTWRRRFDEIRLMERPDRWRLEIETNETGPWLWADRRATSSIFWMSLSKRPPGAGISGRHRHRSRTRQPGLSLEPQAVVGRESEVGSQNGGGGCASSLVQSPPPSRRTRRAGEWLTIGKAS
jgi:hypothetical protein